MFTAMTTTQHSIRLTFLAGGLLLGVACGGAPAPDGTARPSPIQGQLSAEASAARTCPEAQAAFDRFATASEGTPKGTDRSAQNLVLMDVAYDQGAALGCQGFPRR